MDDKIKLKPCPFCGHEKVQPFEREIPPFVEPSEMKIVYFVHCPVCHASGPCCNLKRDLTAEESYAAWNQRH